MVEESKTPAIILSEIQEGLKHAVVAERLESIETLSALTYSNVTLLRQLERMAIKDSSREVRVAALAALDLSVHRQIFRKNHILPKSMRAILVEEIYRWGEDGVLSNDVTEVLVKRYTYDYKKTAKRKIEAKVISVAKPKAASSFPVAKAPAAPKKVIAPSKPPQPKKPKRSLAQVLFSESSIKIALYLGAFFIVATALIFAMMSEYLRLPILLLLTAVFFLSALSLKKRLAQPSFTLFVIFSMLLLVDAGVFADLRGGMTNIYWTFVFLFVAGVWGYGTWFYQSRFFSIAAFAGVMLGAINFSDLFNAHISLDLLLISFAAWGALIAVKLLEKWKDKSFATPLFIASQLAFLGILLVSFPYSFSIALGWGNLWWLAVGITWLLTALAFVFSNEFWKIDIYPYLAVATLMPVPWMILNVFGEFSSPVQIFFAWAWGTAFVFASVLLADFLKSEKWKKYSLPFLLGGGIILGTGILMALARSYDVQSVTSLFFILVGVALTALVLHIYKPQIIYWSISLILAMSAYFLFFELPFMENIEIFMGYKLFVASLLLLLPDSLLPRKMKEIPWRIPLQALGGIATLAFVSTPRESDLQAALLLGLMALFFFFYATRLYVYLAYIATTFLTFSLLYMSYLFRFEIWMPVLIGLSTLYYGGGILLKKREKWSGVFRYSGLVLGSFILFLGAATAQEGWGWYALILVILYALETYTRKFEWMEAGIHISLAFALYGIFDATKINNPTPYILLSIGLVWLGMDILLERTLKIKRPLQIPLRLAASAVVGINTILLTIIFYRETLPAVIGFTVYTLFFLGYALYYRKEGLKYFFPAYLSFVVMAFLQYFEIAKYWLPILFVLSALYYGIGALRLKWKWSHVLRTSGLALGSALILNGVDSAEAYIGWYAILLALAFAFDTFIRQSKWLEAGVHASLGIAVYAIIRDANIQDELTYTILIVGLLWLVLDAIFERTLKIERPLKMPVQAAGGILVLVNTAVLLLNLNANTLPATISFGVYALFFAGYAVYRREARLGYLATVYLPLSIIAFLRYLHQDYWLFPLIIVAVLYYGISMVVKQAKWQKMLERSSLFLGTLVALSAPFEDSGLAASIPVAITATLYVIHAFRKKNLWLGFPANAFYLMAYFMILLRFDIDQPQFFTVAAAALGMLMHYLLVQAGSKKAAFITGMLSQLVLLSTTYIQMVSEEKFIYFLVLFFQAIAVLIYGIVVRSRSLVITPIIFLVLSVLTITFGLLDGLETLILIGCAGVFLIAFGIGALLLREKVASLREKLDDWDA